MPKERAAVATSVVGVGIGSLQAVLTAIAPDPASAAAIGAGSVALSDIAARFLSPREAERVNDVARLATTYIREKLDNGAAPRSDLDQDQLRALFEGTLLAAKDAYEDNKLPLLARLVSVAPFTNTPVDNLLGCLHIAEGLTYRQLCLLSLVKPYLNWPAAPELSTERLGSIVDRQPAADSEFADGVVHDLRYLMGQNLVVHAPEAITRNSAPGDAVPAELMLTYLGRLLYNGMQLGAISEEDRAPILAVLGARHAT